jgi:hypothetical protein
MTGIAIIALLAAAVGGFVASQSDGVPGWMTWMLWGLPLGVLGGTALFCVRGYALSPGELRVKRLFWDTRISLHGLREAVFDPEATRRSIRLMGNGGLFAFTGWFRNTRLGRYRAFLTDPKRTVVLRFPGRTIVVSPHDPEGFIRDAMVQAVATDAMAAHP